MSEPFTGEIKMVGYNFAMRGWALCDGQLLAISQNTALFSLLGTTFGGDGRTTFGLPDLRGRFPRHVGSGAGLDTVTWGQRGGSFQTQLTLANLPSHNHGVQCNTSRGDTADPANAVPADANRDRIYKGGTPNGVMNAQMVQDTGGDQAVNTMNPYLGLYFQIALVGIYPSRS